MSTTTIEWTEATWNPVTGCDRISPGCDSCYALDMARRLKAMGQPHYQADGDPRTSGPGFGLTCHPDALDIPLRWRKPRRVFVNSMSDLFHRDVAGHFIAEVWARMAVTQRHTYQVLTKRPQRMSDLLSADDWIHAYTGVMVRRGEGNSRWPLPNVWLGTSIETDRYTWRADHLRATPAAVRWLSCEPLLGPLPSLDLAGIDWVVAGGESGPRARPMDPGWVRDLRDRCTAAGVPFFFKQWGTWVPYEEHPQPPFWDSQHGDLIDGHHLPADLSEGDPTGGWWAPDILGPIYRRVGKKTAGRLLDGRTWDQYPHTTTGDVR